MFDPRGSIKNLFNDARIYASAEYGSRYVGVYLREENEECVLHDDETGVLILEPPEMNSISISVNGSTVYDVVSVVGNLWMKKERGIKKPYEFINSILDSIENTIIDNHSDIDSNVRVITFDSIGSIPSESKELIRKTMMFTCHGYKVRA